MPALNQYPKAGERRPCMVRCLAALAFLCGGCSLPTEPVVETELVHASGDPAAGDDAVAADALPDAGAARDANGSTPGPRDGGDAADGADAAIADAGALDASVDGGAAGPLESTPVTPPPGPPETFGLACGGTTCPGVPADSEQCCTSATDVEAKNALDVDRCGVLRAAAGGCLELEQQGVPDDGCPTLTPPGAPGAEPGCCTVGGLCGTLDAVEGAGCHVDGSLHEQPCGMEDIEEGTSCEPTGVFAMLADVDVAWGGQSGGLYDITEDGRGKVRVWMRIAIDAVDDDGRFTGELRPCGATLPAFHSPTLCEAYQPVFPDAIWDSGLVPARPLTGQYQCDSPGCILTIDSITGLVGIALDDIEGPWPTPDAPMDVECASGSGVDCYPDHDDDGFPGVTVLLPSDGRTAAAGGCVRGFEYRSAPLNASVFAILDGVRRADRLHLGVRLRLGGAGRLEDDCMRASGAGAADFVQSRATGCLAEPGTRYPFRPAAGDETPCSASEAAFMNENLPIYDLLALGQTPPTSLDLEDDSPGEGMTFSLLRVAAQGSDVSCAEIRAALP